MGILVYPSQPVAVSTINTADACSGELDVLTIELQSPDGSVCASQNLSASLNDGCGPVTETLSTTWSASEIDALFGGSGTACYSDASTSDDVTVYPASLSTNIIDDGSSCGTPSIELLSASGIQCLVETSGTACVDNDDSFAWDFSDDLAWLVNAPGSCAQVGLSGTISCSNCSCVDPVIVEAGNTSSVCGDGVVVIDLSPLSLGSSISGGGVNNGVWSSLGDGVFGGGSQYSTATTYTLGVNDISSGGLSLTLTGNASADPLCPIVSDDLIITVNPVPTAPLVVSPIEYCEGDIALSLIHI